MQFTNAKKLTLPEGDVRQIADASGQVLWKSGPTNRVPLSIDASGSIYNGTGYKAGYRIRSGGAEATQINSVCTGFIPVQPGDVIRISGCGFNETVVNNAINAADASFNNIGQFTRQPSRYGIFIDGYSQYDASSVVEESTGVWRWVVPPAGAKVAYIRLSCYVTDQGANLMITINEPVA